ncbi:MAG: winged helix-turn-helix domain-containing protein [Gammaproteobacteria bacterium]|nr:winged helix-turn-helix domain-containing protein [Gammaproteobacteria bacterium]MCP5317734.1 winged helix-turn-helix domain-containing protein [Chromatiaceae bacterium]MCW5587493.1 winged helix-turn-helix domain-containing protein [Chromatiales bacterium]MCB1816626.1 winged helix-turn-helix domain-containing protein [Gammaproteobacteria bacterium]MCP5429250.1 winged helix-turn-helix domain-containing protein [Chromatiaceae bacterium]
MESETFLVGEYQVHPAANELRVGDVTIALEPKVMALLLYLVQNAGRVVSREQLFRAVWPGVIVSDDTLTQAVAKLRRAFGDSARQPRYVQTVSKRGYRLSAEVATTAADSAPSLAPGMRRMPRLVVVALALLAGIVIVFVGFNSRETGLPKPTYPSAAGPDGLPTLTVQPFRLLGDDASQTYLAQGLTYDLSTDLSKLSGLMVIGSRTLMGIQAEQSSMRSARYLVSGEVQHSAGEIRVHVHLFDAGSGEQLWSERYHRPLGNIFDLQEAISRKIVSSLSIEVKEVERQRMARRYTPSIQAYELFLRAQSLLLLRLGPENDQARRLFRQAIDLDPSFARAYGGLALSYAADFRHQWADDGPAALARAGTMARTALEIDPDIPEVYWVLAYVNAQQRQHEAALGLLRKAIALSPSFADAYALMGGVSTYLGLPAQTLGQMRTAIRLNPDAGYLYYLLLGRAYFFLDDWEQARINLGEAVARNPASLEAHVYLAATYQSVDDRENAAWEREEILMLDAGFRVPEWLQTYPMTDPVQIARLSSALQVLNL